MTGKLITLEGGEGAGKSTVLNAVSEVLAQRGLEVVVTREPGGTPAGEAIRKILLDAGFRGMPAETELLLMFASRAQLVREVIEPALARGQWVLSDRFTDSSFAYQGGGRLIPSIHIESLEHWVINGLKPDLTLLLDLPIEQGAERANTRGRPDRIEMENADFFTRVRRVYRLRAAAEPERFRTIDASRTLADVLVQVHIAITEFLDQVGVGT